MSISACIDRAVAAKEIGEKDGERLKIEYNRFYRDQLRTNGGNAALLAKQLLAKSLQAETVKKRRNLALTVKKIQEVHGRMNALPGGYTKNAHIMLEYLGQLRNGFGGASVDGRRKALLGSFHSEMGDLLIESERTAGRGRRPNAAKMDNIDRELFGIDTKDASAKAMAKAWTATAERARRLYNAAGGSIPHLENWGRTVSHDAAALRNLGKEQWISLVEDQLDLTRMKHPLTGDPVTRGELKGVLDDVFDQITTDGWFDKTPSMVAYGKGSLANRRMEHRFLIFKDPEFLIRYQKQFGEGDAFTSMMGHLNVMARDIAAMEILGPNPDGMLTFIKNEVRREYKTVKGDAKALAKARDKGEKQIKLLDDMWADMRGETETPVSSAAADTFAATRNIIVSSVMGGAVISAATGDPALQMIARRFIGVPAATTVTDIIGQFKIANKREAIEAGLILDDAMHEVNGLARYVGEFSGPEWSKWLADRILTWSGLTPLTQAEKHAFGKATMMEFGRHAEAGTSWAGLQEPLRQTMVNWGLTEAHWDTMRSAALHEPASGVKVLRPREIEKVDEDLAKRYLEMILQESEYATPTSSVQARVMLRGTERPGTLWGEIQKSFGMFKSFAAVFGVTHMRRTFMMIASGEKGVRAKGARYAGGLLAVMTIGGALSLQLKNIAAGRDPEDMTNFAFWGKAVLQGGGLGIYGDFLFSDINRYGGGFKGTLAGPLVERLDNLWSLTGGNTLQFLNGEETHFGREVTRFMRGNTPGGNIFYLRLAYERIFIDQMQFLLDPKANKSFKQTQKRRQKEYGQGYFWAPGQTLPARMPDFGAVIGGSNP